MTRDIDGIGIPDELRNQAGPEFPECPLGLPQVARTCLGFYERGVGRLQLRFGALDNEGLCDVVVEEARSYVAVRVVLCSKEEEHLGYAGLAEERAHIDLEQSLRGRTVLDLETGRAVPFYVPTYLDGRRTRAPGYYIDEDAALAACELQPKEWDRHVARRGGLSQLRTLGF